MRKWILYFIYICVATGFFIYILFPSDGVKDLLAAQIQKAYPDYDMSADRIQPAFPPGLRFDKVGISYKDDLWIETEHIKVIPDYLSIFTPEKAIDFSGRLYKGEMAGSVGIRKEKSSYQYSVAANVSDIDIEEIQRLQEVSGRTISGVLDAVFQINTLTGVEREIVIQLNIADCEVELTNPLFNLSFKRISFENIDAELTIGKESLQLRQCRAVGKQIDGNLAGTILIKDPIGKSILNLRGNIKPHHTLMASVKKILPGNLLQAKASADNGFPIKLYGTIEKPKFSLK
jgi:type II secretion system protein N